MKVKASKLIESDQNSEHIFSISAISNPTVTQNVSLNDNSTRMSDKSEQELNL